MSVLPSAMDAIIKPCAARRFGRFALSVSVAGPSSPASVRPPQSLSRAVHTSPKACLPPPYDTGARRPPAQQPSYYPSSRPPQPSSPARPNFAPRPNRFNDEQRQPPSTVNPLTLTDDRIPFRTVQLVSPETNALSAPTPLSAVLSSYDPSVHTLTLVSTDPPIVKLINKEEQRQKARVAEVKAKLHRKTAIEEKEVQVSWTSAIGDLNHKLDVAKGILEKGDRVNLVFANKSGGGKGDKASQEVQKEVQTMFETAIGEIGVRWKDDERGRGTLAQFWGPIKAVREERRAKVQEEEVGKRKERDERKETRRLKEEERKLRAAKRAQEMAQEAAQA